MATDTKAVATLTIGERITLIDWKEVQKIGLLLLIIVLAAGIGWAFHYAALADFASDLVVYSLAVAGLTISGQWFVRRK